MKAILPLLLIVYFSFSSSFPHTHIINGVTIVHSHPFSKDADGKSSHSHTMSQVHLIHVLTSFFVTTDIIVAYTLGLLALNAGKIVEAIYNFIYIVQKNSFCRLRPPPSLL
ncbi:hypothetical protein [Dysgonomonas sp. 520]|uniref:hypothetical protein n=1 Tax=Dysgonomonas sp. 520 TaxID=2302931 RepID=UPI0013D8681D|nr:hypothetical protein [Dysgonomonas sp. 520]